MANLFTTTYNPPCKGQVKQFNGTIIEALRHYVAKNPREWDLLTDTLTYAYNTKIHRATGCASLKLMLPSPSQPLAVRPNTQDRQAMTTTQYPLRWQQWLGYLMQEAGKEMEKPQRKYKDDFDERVRPPKVTVEPGSFVFERKEFYDLHDQGISWHHLPKARSRWCLKQIRQSLYGWVRRNRECFQSEQERHHRSWS